MDKKTKDILNRDSVSETEKKLGKHWSEFDNLDELLALGDALEANRIATQHLQSINDTYTSMTWTYFKTLLANKGFKKGFEQAFADEDKIEEEIIYYKPDEGLIIWAESYDNREMVNIGNLYGEIKAKSKEDSHIVWEWISSGGPLDNDMLIFSTHHDIREGLFSKLDMLRSAGDFLPKWIEKNPWLWFVNYIEREEHSDEYKQINAKKLAMCPDEMLQIFAD